MTLDLPIGAIIALNVAGPLLIQLACAWVFQRMPVRWFDRPEPIAPIRLGKRLVRGLAWKSLIPDGATWFAGGFAKRSLARRDSDYLRRFVSETRRGEACHWAAFALAPLFLLWNPPWADMVMLLAMAVANLPCIVLQRSNRRRLLAALQRGAQRRLLARSTVS